MDRKRENPNYIVDPETSELKDNEAFSSQRAKDCLRALQSPANNEHQGKMYLTELKGGELKSPMLLRGGISDKSLSGFPLFDDCVDLTDENHQTLLLDAVGAVDVFDTDAAKELINVIAEVIDSFHKALQDISKTTQYLRNINWDDAVKCSYEWARYGWTIVWEAPPKLYFFHPKSPENADEIALDYVEEGLVDRLISKVSKVRDDMGDIHSAKTCYQTEQYKACCLLLSTLIEKVVIKSIHNKNRDVGLKAIKPLKDRIFNGVRKYKEIELLSVMNTLEYLSIIFKRAYDFRVQPEGINRNFLAHGMYENEVTKNDCIKMFLGLYNVVRFYDRFVEHDDL